MRYLAANKIFDGHIFHENKMLMVDETGKIIELRKLNTSQPELENFNGYLVPGLINCHCHLELSHLKDVIPPHTGLIDFLCSVVNLRKSPPEKIQSKIKSAEKEMFENGTVAVGDIGNTADTAKIKANSRISWQNFVEVLNPFDEKAAEMLKNYEAVASQMEASHNKLTDRTSIVPHAPYTVSPQTFRLINERTKGKIISIHNQEHPAEDELFLTGGGGYLKLFKVFGIDHSPIPVTGLSSIRSYLPYFNNQQTIILVHNTYMPEEDLSWAIDYSARNSLRIVFCICPNANLYIENKLPPVELLISHRTNVVLGTDSYSSNWKLSITSEIKTLVENFPRIQPEVFLRWATSDAASLMQWDGLGSFQTDNSPGIVLIEPDFSGSRRII